MKQLIALILVIALLLACAAASILLAFGWFTARTSSNIPAAPTLPIVVPAAPTPTLAALPPAQPAPIGGDTPIDAPGDFNGVFSGTLNGDNGSTAGSTLTLTQTGNAVSGQLDIGPGLVLDAGSCGAQSVPQLTQTAAGAVDPAAPNRLQTTGSIPVAGFTIAVTLSAELTPDGQTLTARADLDLPFLCGRDPVVSGTFSRQ